MKFLCGTKVVLEFCFVPLLILFMQRYVDADQVKKIEGFLEQHCITCHNSSDQSGDRDFEELSLFQTDVETQLLLQEIIDQITLGAMPPEDMEQPTDDARGEYDTRTHGLPPVHARADNKYRWQDGSTKAKSS